ncbi:MAG: Zn-dependent hydrolase [Chloroflexi bacterium]|nr:Zn-dependent hydrolase [Chloroflexota bacterium]
MADAAVLYPHLKADSGRLESDIMALAGFTSPELPYTRLAFSDVDLLARQWLIARMKELGLAVRLDTAANIIGRREGGDPSLPVIMTGSHLDTVSGGGRFDGIAGVLAGLETVRLLNAADHVTRHPLEVVCFTCEEPTVHGLSPFGSRAMAGQLDKGQVMVTVGPTGHPLAQLLRDLGGDPERLEEARLDPRRVLAHLELHIEQGGDLEAKGLPLGVVTAIAAPCRGHAIFTGRASHAGATPMEERADALCAAAELVLAVERVARSYPDTVGTVGGIENAPNMVNVIPGRVELRLEVRSTRTDIIQGATTRLSKEAEAIARRRGVKAEVLWLRADEPVTIPEPVARLLERTCQELGLEHTRIISRASHDSARLAAVIPVGMLFVPSKGGLSHCPEEWTDFEDFAVGVTALARAILMLDAEGLQT